MVAGLDFVVLQNPSAPSSPLSVSGEATGNPGILLKLSYLKRFVTRYRSFGCESEELRKDALTISCKH
jgi:hypothetical protein